MANEMMYSDPYMTPEQMETFQKECIWNDGWWSGRNKGAKQGFRSGYLTGLLIGGVVTATAIIATWMYKNNKTYRIDITDVSGKKEDSENAEN